MNEEIKEILEWLNDKNYYIEDFGYKFKRLSLEENETLLNYITNLQEEKQKLVKVIEDIEKELNKDYNTYICKNKSYGKTFKAGAMIYKEHILNKLTELKERK